MSQTGYWKATELSFTDYRVNAMNRSPAVKLAHYTLLVLQLAGWLPNRVEAQPANDVAVVGPTDPSRRYVRLTFENDVLQLRPTDIRDHDFTNGIRLDLMGNFWGKLFTRHVLLEFPKEPGRTYDYLYSFSVGQEMYTPDDIKVPTIIRNDRPYAGWLYMTSGLITTDPIRARKLTSSVSLGVMGPLSRSDSVQSFVHRLFDFPPPAGWRNQIANDIGLSYAVRYEARPFAQLHRSFDLIGMVEGQLGTVTNFIGAGGMLRIGQFNDYFQNATGLYDSRLSVRPVTDPSLYNRMDLTRLEQTNALPDNKHAQLPTNRRFQAYGFMRPLIRAVLDNSFLQGGWTSRYRNPYTIPSEEIERFYINVEYGGVLSYGRTQLTYTQSFRTREFRFGKVQQWGRISLLLGF